MVRVLSIGKYRIGDIMTPRPEVDWIDADDDRDEMLGPSALAGTSNFSSGGAISTSHWAWC